jgi:hypothetical protein
MKILRKVPVIQIKRCFVIGNICAKQYRNHKIHQETLEEHLKRIQRVEARVLQTTSATLDRFISRENRKRFEAYNTYTWYEAIVSTREVGIWRRAGELPHRWTNRTLEETADKVARALSRRNGFRHPRIRAAQTIPALLKTSVHVCQDNKYLLPIVFKGGTGTKGRKRLKYKTAGDIDDGCMRSVALGVSGLKKIRVYFGVPTAA